MYNSDYAEIEDVNMQSAFLNFELLPDKFWGIGLEFHHSIGHERYTLRDFRIKLGGTLNHGSRVQFPIYPFVSFYGFKDRLASKYSLVGYGVKGGVKFYFTNKIAIQGEYEYSLFPIIGIDDKVLEEAAGEIIGRGISIILTYNIVKLKKS